jgi:flavin reductase (DIM6/NTAB) family NADH-FMN oxidoreductase RutF
MKEIKTDIYHLMHPKMAFFLTSISKEGKPNVMACAWATPVSEEPPVIIVCVEKNAYTAELIKETKEFVINIPRKDLLKALWICGKMSGRKTDKFKKSGLKTINGKKVKAPLIDGCVGHIECRLWKTVEAGECYAFFGRVRNAEADEKYMKKGLWSEESEIPLHLGGSRIIHFKG